MATKHDGERKDVFDNYLSADATNKNKMISQVLIQNKEFGRRKIEILHERNLDRCLHFLSFICEKVQLLNYSRSSLVGGWSCHDC